LKLYDKLIWQDHGIYIAKLKPEVKVRESPFPEIIISKLFELRSYFTFFKQVRNKIRKYLIKTVYYKVERHVTQGAELSKDLKQQQSQSCHIARIY
jgi:hypothetical protein